jgi:hypothetical protein
MVRPKQEEIDAQLAREELDTDGSGSVSGSAPVSGTDATASTEEMVKDAFGNEPDDEEGFNSGLEVNKDEVEIRDGEDEEEGELDSVEKKENVTEDAASDDPYEVLGEDDDLDAPSEE